MDLREGIYIRKYKHEIQGFKADPNVLSIAKTSHRGWEGGYHIPNLTGNDC